MNLIKSSFFLIILISMSFTVISSDKSSQDLIDSLKSVLEVSLNEDRFHVLLELSEQTLGEDHKQAEIYMKEAWTFVEGKSASQNLFDYYKHMAGVKLSQKLFAESIELSDKALRLEFPELNYKDHINIYNSKARAYHSLGKNDRGHEALFSSLELADSLQFDTLKANIYNTIGILYATMSDTMMAEKYFSLALNQERKVQNYNTGSPARTNLAAIYMVLSKYEEAEKLMLENIQLAKQENNYYSLNVNYNSMGLLFREQEKYKDALESHLMGLEAARQSDKPIEIAKDLMSISQAYIALKDYDSAKENIEASIKAAIEQKNATTYNVVLEAASQIYEQVGEPIKALEYYKEHIKQNDSILNESRIKIVAELEQKYESEKKEKEILSLSNDKVVSEKRERTLIQTILLLCFGLMSLGALIYFLRQNHIKNSIIQEKNLKIADDKIELLEKGKEIIALESLVKGQEIERERLAKEMHDGLGGLLAISHSKLSHLDNSEKKTNSALTETRDMVGEAYNQVRQISHNLMPLDLEKFGLVAALDNMIQRINRGLQNL